MRTSSSSKSMGSLAHCAQMPLQMSQDIRYRHEGAFHSSSIDVVVDVEVDEVVVVDETVPSNVDVSKSIAHPLSSQSALSEICRDCIHHFC